MPSHGSGDDAAQDFARQLGAVWAGPSEALPPQPLDAAIIFAPAGYLVPLALKAVRKGGRVVCGGIHMSDIPSFPYDDLWGEREIVSVANLTRRDAEEFLRIAPLVPVRTESNASRWPMQTAPWMPFGRTCAWRGGSSSANGINGTVVALAISHGDKAGVPAPSSKANIGSRNTSP